MKKQYLILLPLLFSGFTHLWNPVGFPDIFFDEGVYVGRAYDFVQTGILQQPYYFDHPYFGQIILASVFALSNLDVSDSLQDFSSLKNLYLFPRIFVGVLAVFDTLLIYMIASKRYGQNVALIASILFAVMPFTWILRGILLDSLLLPLMLASILIAIHSENSQKRMPFVLVSGILLGLAIFTKIPAFTMIPLVAFIIFSSSKSWKNVGIWLIPVILIPLIWPVYSVYVEQFEYWEQSVIWQSQRTNDLLEIIYYFLLIDPFVFLVGFSGIVYSAIRKDWFVLLWLIPFLLFTSSVGYKQYFHLIPIFPVLCIGGAIILEDIVKRIQKPKIRREILVVSITVFGLLSTGLVIVNDLSGSQFEVIEYVLKNVDDSNTTILASPIYSWIFLAYDKENVLLDYSQIMFYPIETEKVMLIADEHFLIDIGRGKELSEIYNKTKTIETFRGNVNDIDNNPYPYTSMKLIFESSHIEVRVN